MSERLVKKVNVVGRGSLSVVIPKRWADSLGIKPGDRVFLGFDGSRIIISPATSEEGEEVNLMIEAEPRELALMKLIASYIEGVTRIKVRASYERVLELSEGLKDYVTGFVLMADPSSTVHELAFSDVKTSVPSALRILEAVSEELLICAEERCPSIHALYREFRRKYLYFLRAAKRGVAEGSLDPHDALDLVMTVEYVKELFDFIVALGLEAPEEDRELSRVLDLARAAISANLAQDIETAMDSVTRILGLLEGVKCSSGACRNVKYLVARLSEAVLGRCVRTKACRCKYFFPKV